MDAVSEVAIEKDQTPVTLASSNSSIVSITSPGGDTLSKAVVAENKIAAPKLKIIHVNELYAPAPPVLAVQNEPIKFIQENETTEPSTIQSTMKLFRKQKPKNPVTISITDN